MTYHLGLYRCSTRNCCAGASSGTAATGGQILYDDITELLCV